MRPLSITIIAWLFVAVGCGSLVYHTSRFVRALPGANTAHELADVSCAAVSAVAAIIAGAFLLRARNWARWLCVAWLAFHVALSMFHPLSELLIHAVFLAVIATFLFLPRASLYFTRPR